MPVANYGEDKQEKRDQQKARSFRGVNRVPGMLPGGFVFA
jgi:hypothetical protein